MKNNIKKQNGGRPFYIRNPTSYEYGSKQNWSIPTDARIFENQMNSYIPINGKQLNPMSLDPMKGNNVILDMKYGGAKKVVRKKTVKKPVKKKSVVRKKTVKKPVKKKSVVRKKTVKKPVKKKSVVRKKPVKKKSVVRKKKVVKKPVSKSIFRLNRFFSSYK